MIERIWQLLSEVEWVLSEIVGTDFALEKSLTDLQAALDDLEAVSDPSDEQAELIFSALATVQAKLVNAINTIPIANRSLIENLTDRIDIFLFHHRL